MMLRYTGVRQQGLRVCRLGWNVYFNKDGSITFHWRENEIKNDIDFTKTIKPEHINTFAPLVKALRLYHLHIYPHLLKLAKEQATDIEKQLFPEITASGMIRLFPEKSPQGSCRFNAAFQRLTRKFFDFSDIAPLMRRRFNAHHIRGIAGDWLHHEVGVGTEGTAKFLGDRRLTTEKKYLDKKRIDSTLINDEANDRASLIKKRQNGTTSELVDNGAIIDMYKLQIGDLRDQMSSIQEQHRAERTMLLEHNSALKSQLEIMNGLLEQLTKNNPNVKAPVNKVST